MDAQARLLKFATNLDSLGINLILKRKLAYDPNTPPETLRLLAKDKTDLFAIGLLKTQIHPQIY